MMKVKYLPVIFLMLMGLSHATKAQQDPLYNLYQFNQFMINPAYAGIYNNFNANLVTRKQWAGIEGSPQTNMLSLHSSISDQFGGGLLLINDRLGINSNTEFQMSFAYKLITGSKTLAFGVQGGLINFTYDYNELNLAVLDDEDLDFNNDNFSRGNFGTGLFYMTDKYYLGFSVPRILNVTVDDGVASSTRYEPHYYLSGGFIMKSQSVQFVLKPSFLIRYTGDNQVAADISLNGLFANTFWAGLTLRNLSGVAINTQFQVYRYFRLGYSFELPTNQLVMSNFGTHEISVLVELNLFKDQFDIERYF
ncbi:MAG: type IX secretion system membrane protein PorP/SprF [Bacteroidota bacterium]